MTKRILEAIFYVVVFLAVQAIVEIAARLVFHSSLISHPSSRLEGGHVVVGAIVSSIITIALFAWQHWTPVSRDYLRSRPWAVIVWTALLAIGTIIPSAWLQEQMGAEMPEVYKQLFIRIMNHPLGYLTIGILVPVAEEVVFRGAMLRTLLKVIAPSQPPPEGEGRVRKSRNLRLLPLGGRSGGGRLRSGWGSREGMAVLLSALVFGACHGNLPQFVHATLIGLLLGWLYLRTGSIVPGIVFHWVNNTIAFVVARLMPGLTETDLIDLCGGDLRRELLYVGFSLCIFLPALYQLHLRTKRPAAD